MAPTSTSTTVLQQNRLRPTGARRVVPAIPLPYIQKRKQQEAALAKAKAREEAQAAARAPTPVPAPAPVPADVEIKIETPPPPTPPASEVTPAAVNETHEPEAEVVESSVEPSLPDTPLTPPTIEGEMKVEIEVAIEIETAAETSSARKETPGMQTEFIISKTIAANISGRAFSRCTTTTNSLRKPIFNFSTNLPIASTLRSCNPASASASAKWRTI